MWLTSASDSLFSMSSSRAIKAIRFRPGNFPRRMVQRCRQLVVRLAEGIRRTRFFLEHEGECFAYAIRAYVEHRGGRVVLEKGRHEPGGAAGS